MDVNTSDHFKFRSFDLMHDDHVMKTSTDSILLGAWASQFDFCSALDIGCGSGILSFMLAQVHPKARILGVDISKVAVQLSEKNKLAIPFAYHVSFENCHFNEIDTDLLPVDLIISNPPYFRSSLLPGKMARQWQRHDIHFDFDMFAIYCHQHLNQHGFVCVVIPYHMEPELSFKMALNQLYLVDVVVIIHKKNDPPSICLCRYTSNIKVLNKSYLELFDNDNQMSSSYKELTKSFYI